MEDDHVDRPGVEVRQRMKLTGTNSSIGLIVLIACAHRTKFDDAFVLTRQRRCGRRAGRPAARLCRLLVPREKFKDVFTRRVSYTRPEKTYRRMPAASQFVALC